MAGPHSAGGKPKRPCPDCGVAYTYSLDTGKLRKHDCRGDLRLPAGTWVLDPVTRVRVFRRGTSTT